MSLHFELYLACFLKIDTPEQVIRTLQYMTRTEDYDFNDPPDDALFKNPPEMYNWGGWLQRLSEDGDQYWWFPGTSFVLFRKEPRYFSQGDLVEGYAFNLRYFDHDDTFYDYFVPFVPWLAQYSETEGCVGFFREEADKDPTLIYFVGGKAYSRDVGAFEMQGKADIWFSSTNLP